MKSPETHSALVEMMRVCGLDGSPQAFQAAAEAAVDLLGALMRLDVEHHVALTQRRIRSTQRSRLTQTSVRASPRPGSSKSKNRAAKSA